MLLKTTAEHAGFTKFQIFSRKKLNSVYTLRFPWSSPVLEKCETLEKIRKKFV